MASDECDPDILQAKDEADKKWVERWNKVVKKKRRT